MKSWINNLMLAACAAGALHFVNRPAQAQYVVTGRPVYVAPYYGPTVVVRRPLLAPRRIVAYPAAPVVVGYPAVPVVGPTVVNYAPTPVVGPTVVNYGPAYAPTVSSPTVVGYPGTTVYYGAPAPSPAVVYPLPSVVYPPAVFP